MLLATQSNLMGVEDEAK